MPLRAFCWQQTRHCFDSTALAAAPRHLRMKRAAGARGSGPASGRPAPQRPASASSPQRGPRSGAATASLAGTSTAKFLPRTILSPKWRDRGNHLARSAALDEASQRLARAQDALDAAEADASLIELARVYTAKLQHRYEILNSMTQADRLWYLTQMKAVSPVRGTLAAGDLTAAVTGLDAPDTPPQARAAAPAAVSPRPPAPQPPPDAPLANVPVYSPEPSPLPRPVSASFSPLPSHSPVTDSRRSARISSAFADAFAVAQAASSRPASMALPEGWRGSAAFSGADAAQAAMQHARNRLASDQDVTAALLFGSDASGNADPALLKARLEALESIDAAAKEASRGRRRAEVLHFRQGSGGGRNRLGSQGSIVLAEEGSVVSVTESLASSPSVGGEDSVVLGATVPTPFPVAASSTGGGGGSNSGASSGFTARDATFWGLATRGAGASVSQPAATAPASAAGVDEAEAEAGLAVTSTAVATQALRAPPQPAPVQAPVPAPAPAPAPAVEPSRGRRSSIVPLLEMPGTKPTPPEAAAALELPSADLSADVAQRLASRAGRPASTAGLAPSVAALLSGRARSASAPRGGTPSEAVTGGGLSAGPSLVGPAASDGGGGGGSGPGSEGVTPMASLSSVTRPAAPREAPKALVFRGKQVIIPVVSSDLSSDDGGGFGDDFESLSE